MVGTTRPRISFFMQRFRNLGETNREHFLIIKEKEIADYLTQIIRGDGARPRPRVSFLIKIVQY